MKQIVIGANWGDEGKGLVTDALAAQAGPNTLVVRFNGGAQAGHTVTTPLGKRHVFSHMSSGTLAGASTHLSHFFITNPILFEQELIRLGPIYLPEIIVSPQAPVTTFYDMMINHISEKVFQHGSCGTGIWETVVRDRDPNYRLRYIDLMSPTGEIRQKLRKIKEGWVPYRLTNLLQDSKVWEKDEIFRLVMDDPNLTDRWLESASDFVYSTHVQSNWETIRNTENIIFEGAQGLQLDQTYGHYPNITGSYTGMMNVVSLLGYDLEEVEVIYVTRPYFTRHGNGPLPNELRIKPYSKIEDLTNVPDNYRGALRYAYLDLNILRSAISTDLTMLRNPYKLSLAITCLDQLDNDSIHYYHNGKLHESKIDHFLACIKTWLGLDKIYTSFGPTRTTFKEATVPNLITV